MINSALRAKKMHKITSCLVFSLTILMSTLCFAERQTGPISVLNYAQKIFSIQGVKYQIAEKVMIKELNNEKSVSLFAELAEGSYLQVEFAAGSTQPKEVTKAYLLPQ